MQRNICCIIISIIFAITCVQAQTTFEKTYYWSSSSVDNAINTGYIQSYGYMGDPSFVITDNKGDFVRGKKYRFSEDAIINHIQTDQAGNYIISGMVNTAANSSAAFVLNLNSNADLIWSGFEANSGLNRSLWAERTSDGGISSCGGADGTGLNGKGFLTKYNSTGTREWSKTYSWSGQDKFTCVKELSGGGFILCGMVALEPSGMAMGEPKGYLLLMKTDALGIPVWTKIINVINHSGSNTKGNLTEVHITNQGIYAAGWVTDEIITEGVMIFCDLNGNNLNIGTFSSSGFCTISGMGAITDDGNGNLLTIGGGYSNGCNYFDLYKLQPDLNIIWSKRYQGLAGCWNMSASRFIRRAPDGGYILSAGSLLKLDANGEIKCASWTPLQKNPCTWSEPVYVLQQATMLSIAAPVFTVIDTTISPQINCADTTFGSTACNEQFTVTVTQTNLCAGSCAQLSCAFNNIAAIPIYQWTIAGGDPNHAEVEDPGQVCFDHAGTYQVILHATAACADTVITIPIQVNSVDVSLSNYSGCAGEVHTLDAGNFPGAQYTWSNGAQTQEITVTQSGYYSVTVSSGDCSGTAGALITLANPPLLDLPSQLTVCTGEIAQVLAGDGANHYTWSDGSKNPLLTTSYDGTYYVTATNACGQDIDSIEIIIRENCEQGELFIPNSFAPDNNGVNDVFGAQGENVTYFNMQIFDRWGELLFSSNSIDQHWDGTYQGKVCKHDAYVYRITYSIGSNSKKTRLGKVMLIL